MDIQEKNRLTQLETYEWTRIWWDKPSEPGKRILLIGDSITDGYHTYAKKEMNDGAYIDKIASSLAIDNPQYFQQIQYMMEFHNLQYNTIHFNNGLHGFHMDKKTYELYMEKVLNYMLETVSESQLIIATSTPITEKDRIHYQDLNKAVLERNCVVLSLAEKYQLEIDDLYTLVNGNADIRSDDGYHYTDGGYQLLGSKVGGIILKHNNMHIE